MSMDPVSIVALILSIIAILLWLYNFISHEKARIPEEINKTENKVQSEKVNSTSFPDVKTQEIAKTQEEQLRVLEQQIQWESRFMQETQKFSQMARKNLEMLNTRVGIKFDVKPISDDFKKKPRGPEFVNSMEVSENSGNEFDVEDSQ